MQFPGLKTNEKDAYPIQWIDIDSFVHKKTSLELIKKEEGRSFRNREAIIHENVLCQRWYSWMETALPLLDKDRGFQDEEPEHPVGKEVAEKTKDTMLSIYRDLKEHDKLWNPIHAFKETDGKLYIMVGSQRLCALRALKYKGELPTRLLLNGDRISTRRNPPTLYHPYVDVPTLENEEYKEVHNIACVLRSGGDFTWDHVRNLRQKLDENLTLNFTFFCLTDTFPPKGYEDVANIIPLKHDWPGWWSKIELFRVFKSVFYLDLDTTIVGNIDRIVSFDHVFTALHDFYQEGKQGKKLLCSGLMAWRRDYSLVYKIFSRSPRNYMDSLRGDQDFIRTRFSFWESFQELLPREVVSYKIHVQKEGRLPEKAKIVCFHGRPRIHEVDESWMKV